MAITARAQESGAKERSTSSSYRTAHGTSPLPPAPSTLPVEEQVDAQSCALVPTSPDACRLTPCTCAVAGLDVKSFLSNSDAANDLLTELIRNLRRRGPDTYGMTRRSFVTSCHTLADRHLPALLQAKTYEGQHGSVGSSPSSLSSLANGAVALRTEVAGVASVLGLRGHSTVAQPYDMNVATDAEDDRQANSWDFRSSLMWNGEIFGGSLCPPPWGSDTVLLATRLSQMELECVRLTVDDAVGTSRGDDEAHPQPVLLPLVERQRAFLRKCTMLFEQQVEGPYSFIFLATRLRLAVFGRDPLGRHSLLSHVRVTRPISGGVAAEELDVELIVSSVGVQHHHPGACKEREGSKTEERNRPPTPTTPSHIHDGTEGNSKGREGDAPLSSSSALSTVHIESSGALLDEQAEESPGTTAITITAAAPGFHARSYNKRPRHEKRTAMSKGAANMDAVAASAAAAAVDEEEDGEEVGGAAEGATCGVEGQQEVCWQEVGVTGLFAVPLQAPLIYGDLAAFHPHDGAGVKESGGVPSTTGADRLHPVCVSSTARDSIDNAGGATMVCGANVLLLHCPWHHTYHLVHPLLRTATLPMVPHEPPPFELVLAHEEIAVLPEPLLRWASHLMKSMQPDGGLIQSWVDWAAAHYMLALAVSMHRRITVANSGAADGRDAQELSTARRRPLCILFSGGIDCTVIAALAHYILPVETPIELVNVAFGDNPAEAPDRIAAFRSTEELLRLPLLSTSRSSGDATDAAATAEREWRLVLVDVPSKATLDSAHIKDLLVPQHTVMDLDIGTALWHAARATGRMQILKRSDVDGAAAAGGDSSDGTLPMTATGSPTTATTTTSTSLTALHVGGVRGSPRVTLDGFSKHFRAYAGATAAGAGGPWDGAGPADAPFPGPTASSSANASAVVTSAAPTPSPRCGVTTATSASLPFGAQGAEEVANTQKYQILVDVLVKEGRSGGGPLTPVLLSTLGKEYSLFLQPHIKRYGYKKLGGFLNDAAKAGYIKFVPDALSKAVRLCRAADMERAAAVRPSPWFTTVYMQAQEPTLNASGVRQPALPFPGTFFQSYASHAKVLLLGMGADETLGGYTRYRRFFQREGMVGAQRELERDFARLWQRNLGRDDRVTMDSGREPRFPFLDEGVLRTLEWIILKRRNNILVSQEHLRGACESGRRGGVGNGGTSLPGAPTSSLATGTACRSGAAGDNGGSSSSSINSAAAVAAPLTHDELLRLALEPIVSFRLPPGDGDKRVLRRVASVLGLNDVTHLQKRAIQFGSRIAERKIKGTMDF
ncbi:hypothetical protein ABB37_04730 [Leptomonas pyrrhocoris]|uniref:Glutamine amidotransferase type-2 domain-containing protein n=1 Tax=Leptomonas pyrrhocoris TaxID=157538 RepID=A0A0N0DVL5_LEPPY|nr:hypothetical protein ABB37_04730 [Leptomonas pyrrhocoris]KPA80518.1 hypothetical protein ABB37_04730 [Leptomonas pyrrhocoris]|eukprot:XP_015658957.1 hypothetical protein ABB37_04730 [Leptomonas pyrrhocoris]